jgi:hydroxymethylbilane synthase
LKKLTLGTRGSKLALWQAHWVEERMRSLGFEVVVQVIQTRGDRDWNLPLVGNAVKELFVKEIEDALLQRQIDLAVHSVKDLPSELPQGLVLAAIPERADPRDVLISKKGLPLRKLPSGARLGTSSLRRQAQILAYRPDLEMLPIRGNVETRIRKLSSSELDGVVLAAAGLSRLRLLDQVTEFFEDEVCLSAPGQGAIGIESLLEKKDLFGILDDWATRAEVQAERAFLNRLRGGCRVPIAARARLDRSILHLKGLVCSPDGKIRICSEGECEPSVGEEMGHALAEQILARGGEEVLRGVQ